MRIDLVFFFHTVFDVTKYLAIDYAVGPFLCAIHPRRNGLRAIYLREHLDPCCTSQKNVKLLLKLFTHSRRVKNMLHCTFAV